MIKLVALITTLFCFHAFAGGEEEQRKYVFKTIDSNVTNLVTNGMVNGLSVKGHSTYTYYDIYLDTANFALYKNNLSLRIRKRIFADGSIEFGMQLKSEMVNNGDVRMEVEEDELRFYNIYHNGVVFKLKEIIAGMFDHFEAKIGSDINSSFANDKFMLEQIDIINSWTSFKMKAAIAPFQKLMRQGINLEELKTLRPVLIGQSIRKRSHIFINRDNTTQDLVNYPASIRSQLETPVLVQGDRVVWTMESSLDNAKFYSLFNARPFHQIAEYEVENKFLPNENSTELLERFENGLIQDYQGEVNLESKFKQTMNQLLP